MDTSLLSTTIRVPPRPRRHVERPRLSDRLERGVPVHRLTLVAAPAGYGKSTALAAWARGSALRVGWVTAGPALTGAESLLRSMIRAWEAVEPDIRQTAPALLLSGAMPDLEVVVAGIVNLDRDPDDHAALVIDDVHLIAAADVHATLATLIDHLPPWLHIVLAGRGEPSLPISRYRARQELLELGSADLAFTPAETARFLVEVRGGEAPAELVEPLQRQLEGWIAGLQLAALTLPEGAPPRDVVVRGRHRFIADYLRDDVLAQMPAGTRRFLLQTSIVDRLSGSLCDAITGATGGQDMLEALERQNLFTTPLDDERQWFRYHPILADVLAEELARRHPDEIPVLHRRAATWYLARGLADPAFDHALAAGDRALVSRVLNAYGMVKVHTLQLGVLKAWLDALPEEWFAAEPDFVLLRVAVLVFTGHYEAGMRALDDVERAVATAEVVNERSMGRVTAVRCFLACEANDVAQAEHFAEVALGYLPASDDDFRAGVWGALGDVHRHHARWSEAHANYLRALPHATSPDGEFLSVHVYGGLADLELRQGHLGRAASYWRQAMELIAEQRLWGAYPLPVVGWVHIRLGEILCEWNQLDAAREHLGIGREQARLGDDPRVIVAGDLLAARLALAAGDHQLAERELERARATIDDTPFPEWQGAVDRCRVALWLAEGRASTAIAWAETAAPALAGAPPDSEPARVALARVLLGEGDPEAAQRARRLLAELRDTAAAEGRIGVEVEALALLAAERQAAGDEPGALTAIERALRLAEPEGYVRIFVELGPPVARVLQVARDRGVMPDYVRALLRAAGVTGDAAGAATLPEPLSDRERDVLGLLAAGLTNREIAETLFISPETVKKHTSSIYGKLGARNRTEAVGMAREHGLLG